MRSRRDIEYPFLAQADMTTPFGGAILAVKKTHPGGKVRSNHAVQ
jgi:hypothetical protein